ncbi:MAG: HD domain-containing protein [Treponema sp.]|jgi:putative two-component system response regulator|nr:HD domain-containing protein [Treponema sp.]
MDSDRNIIIMVDDDVTNLTTARNNLAGKYDIFTAPSGEKLFFLLDKIKPDLILLDIEMPEMNGFQVMEKLKKNEKVAYIPVIFLTAKIDPETEIEGLNLGAVDYITKPFSRELIIKRIDLHILFEKQRKKLLQYSLSLETEIDKKTEMVLELQNAILRTVAELVECRDNVTGGHIERTQHYLYMLVDFLLEHGVYTEEISSWDINLLIMSSQLHDVGKISIKDYILMKPDKLNEEEIEEMKKHTLYGVELIKRIESNTRENNFLKYAEIFAGSHHEKWNGKGYPHGLKGEEIPLQGRLMAIVDVYDALTEERPYKKAFSHEDSIKIIKEERGAHFDPSVVDVFITHEKEFKNKDLAKMNIVSRGEMLRPTIKFVSGMVGNRSGKNHGHVEKIQDYLSVLINGMLYHESFVNEIKKWDIGHFLMSAQLHDVGEIAVADNILNKSNELTNDEYESMKTHADFGVKVIQRIKGIVNNNDLLQHAEALTGSHHERWDGTGYPHGLKGKEIPLQGRIMALVDVYNALTTDRPHRGRKTHKEAVEIIVNGSGSHFDPALVDVFIECESEFEILVNR